MTKNICYAITVALSLLPFGALAQSYGSLYGGSNSNNYSTYGNGYSGYNANTGSTWSAQTYGNVTRGTDSSGNSWSYDKSSGIYQNYGTGEIRSRGRSIYEGR